MGCINSTRSSVGFMLFLTPPVTSLSRLHFVDIAESKSVFGLVCLLSIFHFGSWHSKLKWKTALQKGGESRLGDCPGVCEACITLVVH